ncbi:MAG: hypothetical protein SF052_01595 [Bacteroidia bacterium]|nr:hypothetical protein [Bacteroidia bacterium]
MHKHEKRKCHGHYRYRGHWGGGIIGLLISGLVVKILWNILIPSLFGGPVIGFLHAIGLVILGKFLAGGVFRGGCQSSCQGGDWEQRRAHWREKMKEKMEGMTPEEKKKFKEGFMGGKWDVNVFEVNEEKESEDPQSPEKEGGEKKDPE